MKKSQGTLGVNLGGWFIPERWMSPSLFEGSRAHDLYGLLQTAGGVSRYKKHLETWITEEDFKWLSANGIRLTRLPVGYWALKNDDVYPDTKQRLDWAFEMAEKYEIKILLDLHGLKGSQNGKDHSGRGGSVDWHIHEAEMLDVLASLAERYSLSTSLWGIEIINEPKVWGNYFRLLRYYRRAYARLKRLLRPGQYVVFQDGFMPLLFMNCIWGSQKHPVAMDTHLYALPAAVAGSERRYFWLQSRYYSFALWITQWFQPVIVGEWSGVLPQRMFDRHEKEQHASLLQDTIERQRAIYTHALASMYWNYKTEQSGMWNFRSLVDDKIIKL